MFNRIRPTIGGEVLTSADAGGVVTLEHVNNAGSLIWKVSLHPEAARELRDFLNSQNLG